MENLDGLAVCMHGLKYNEIKPGICKLKVYFWHVTFFQNGCQKTECVTVAKMTHGLKHCMKTNLLLVINKLFYQETLKLQEQNT